MQRLLRLLGTRFGAAVGLLLLIAIVVSVAKVAGGSARTPVIAGGASTPSATATESQEADDGLDSAAPTPPPSTSPGAADPQTVAIAFTHAWINHVGITAQAWHTAVARYSTAALSAKLANTDPADVPATEIMGAASMADHVAAYVDVSIPLNGGTVVLRLLATNGVWLVDGVDWQRS